MGAVVIFGLGFFTYFMTKSDCNYMTPQCLIFVGLCAFVELCFHLVSLFHSLAGHTERYATTIKDVPPFSFMDAHGHKGGVPIIISTHFGFFDSRMGWNYNLQSATLIITPVVLLLTTLLCYQSYKEFPSPFDDPEDGWPQGGFGRDYPHHGDYGGIGDAHAGPGEGAQGQAWQAPPHFSGTGQRLGS